MSFLVNSYSFRYSSSFLLDLYPATVAYSLRQLKFEATNVVRVRRSSDNAQQDFTATQVTDGTLTTFTGAGNGFVTTWYDQSGNGYNVTQASQANQPQIVASGVLVTENGKTAIQFDGTNDVLISSAFSLPTATANSQFIVSTYNLGSFTLIPIGATSTTTVYEHLFIPNFGGGYLDFQTSRYGHPFGNTGFGSNLTQAIGDQVLLSTIYNGSNISLSSSYNYNVDAVSLTTITGGAIGNLSEVFAIGGRSVQNSNMFSGKIQEIVIYNTDQTANRTAIETDINSHYGIY